MLATDITCPTNIYRSLSAVISFRKDHQRSRQARLQRAASLDCVKHHELAYFRHDQWNDSYLSIDQCKYYRAYSRYL